MGKIVEIKRALVSVSDKEGLDELVKYLDEQGVEIIASGGTAKYLQLLGIDATPIEEVTGNPEAFGGRMKTISFQVASALLYRREHNEDVTHAQKLGINPIDLVICNLYPFEQVMKRDNVDIDELIENID